MSSAVPSTSPDALARAHDHLLVRVGAERFALPLAAVAEAVEAPALRSLAGVAAHCLGTMRWRERHVAVHDGAAVFGVAVTPPATVALVLADGDPVAVAADELLDVVSLPPAAMRPWAGRLDPHRVVGAVAWHGGELVAVVRPEAVRAACAGATPASTTGAGVAA